MSKKLFSPFKIGNCEIPNRLVVPAMVTNYCNEDGTATEQFISYHETKAKGGWGLIITEDYAINPNARGYKYIGGLYNDEQIASHQLLTDRIHQYDSKIFCQIYHPGRQTNHTVNGGVQPVAPSAIPCPWNREMPRELTVAEIKELVEDFGDCALRVKKAGFDGLELHAAHGYLLAEFLSPLTNKRTDQYGGCLENRIRIISEVYENMRSKVGDDFPIVIRFSADEGIESGREISESRVMALMFEEMGFDALHVSTGIYGDHNKGIVSSMYMPHAWAVDFAAEIKKLVSIPVITVNRINNPQMAESILKLDKADFVAMGRGSLADPALPNKAKAGDYQSIRYCIGCLQGCTGALYLGTSVTCTVNPSVGLEYKQDLSTVESPKKVMVIGAGPGGMEAARNAALKGHSVTIFEKTSHLGGQFRSAAYPPYKGDFATWTAWFRNELEKLNVEIRFSTEVTTELVREENPDVVIVATGGDKLTPGIKGIDKPHVVYAEDALVGDVACGDQVVVIGGGDVGTETAAHLAMAQKNVTIVEMLPQILSKMDGVNKFGLTQLLENYNVEALTETTVKEILDDAVILEKNGIESVLHCDTVVIASGYKPNNALAEQLKEVHKNVIVIGGANQTGDALIAAREGMEAGLAI